MGAMATASATRRVAVWFLLFGGLVGLNRSFSELAEPVTIPLKFSHGRMIVSAKINELGPLTFLLDSACTIPTLHPKLMDQLKIEPSGHVLINGIAGEERAPTYRGVVIDFGPLAYSPRRVASVPSEREEKKRRDGVLDSGFFRRYVVELLADKHELRLHSPTNFNYTGTGEIIPFRFRQEIPVVEAEMVLPDKSVVNGDFEVDTGCDSGLCIGESFVRKHKLVEQIGEHSSEKFGIGGSVETRNASVPAFRMGSFEVTKVQTDLFLNGSPVDDPLAGHIGMGVLGRSKVIFDYARKRLILEK